VRWSDNEKLIVISNFNAENTYGFELELPKDIVEKWNLENGEYQVEDQLYNTYKSTLNVRDNEAKVRVDVKPLESFILKIKE
jgi:bifunctional DNase/RNase